MRRWFNGSGVVIGTLTCCWGAITTLAADKLAPTASQFTAQTEDGRIWSGDIATIDIRPELPDGAPAVAELSFAVLDARGNILGVYLEMDPAILLHSSQTGWAVSLDHVPSTKPGFGVFTYASSPSSAPSAARKGALNGVLRGKVLEGDFSSDADGIARGTFGGSYLVRCWIVSPDAALSERQGSVGGNLSGGYAMVEDSSFSTPFCSGFGNL